MKFIRKKEIFKKCHNVHFIVYMSLWHSYIDVILIEKEKRMIERNVKVIAHRGIHGDMVAENSLLAFQAAIDAGCDMIELDVRKTKDNSLVIIHDDNIAGQKINSISYKKLLIESSKYGYQVPTLEQVLKLCKKKILLDIEMKEQDYEEEVVSLVMQKMDVKDFIISSFHRKSLQKIRKKYPSVRIGMLLGRRVNIWNVLLRLNELFPVIRLLKIKPDVLLPHYKVFRFWRFFTLFIKKPVIIWTVNEIKEMKMLIQNKVVHGIITDNVSLLKDVVE